MLVGSKRPVTEFRSSHLEEFLGKGVMKYAANLQESAHAEVQFQ